MSALDEVAARRADWTVSCWRPNEWLLRSIEDAPVPAMPVWGPIAAQLPGTVNDQLVSMGLLPSPYVGTNSNQHEWVEHRDWMFSLTTTEVGARTLSIPPLEHKGSVLINQEVIATIDPGSDATFLSVALAGTTTIEVVLQPNPSYLGQTNWSSRIDRLQPRFAFGWDWTPRLVPIGLEDAPRLEDPQHFTPSSPRVTASYSRTAGAGSIEVADASIPLLASLYDAAGELVMEKAVTGESSVLEIANPRLWFPNGMGEQYLYTLVLRTVETRSTTTEELRVRVGFRQFDWGRDVADPVDTALRLSVNGERVYLQGFNWTPLAHSAAQPRARDYRQRLELYAAAGTTVLRVWGGALLEGDAFYEICDELGLIVWQDLPFSSSGLENTPPYEPEQIDAARSIARRYAHHLSSHPCAAIFSGGNELQTAAAGGPGNDTAVTIGHPLISAMAEEIGASDSGIRFVPTSPSGPRFVGEVGDLGKGILEDVHGPWFAPSTFQDHKSYWDADDAVLRSEVGCQGAASAELITKYFGDSAWPNSESNTAWRHASAWWHHADRGLDVSQPPTSLQDYVRQSQRRQARYLAYAAATCRARGGAGFIVWMGHDVWPCPVNTSVIDFDGIPKPAFWALARVFRSTPDQLAKALREGREPWMNDSENPDGTSSAGAHAGM